MPERSIKWTSLLLEAAHRFRGLYNFKIKLGSKELAIGKPIANFLVNSLGRQGMSGVRYSSDNPKLQSFLNAQNFYKNNPSIARACLVIQIESQITIETIVTAA